MNPWNLSLTLEKKGKSFLFRNVEEGDLEKLLAFREELSSASRDLFCPYPWDREEELTESLKGCISNHLNQVDAAYILLEDEKVVGHCFLWGITSLVPELGVAIADRYHGLGLGSHSVRTLLLVAEALGVHAVELTTALGNEGGWRTYLKAGFQYTGLIRNPLEVNVKEAEVGEVRALKYRTERQMVYIIDQSKREEVLTHLSRKRVLSKKR